MGARCEGRGDLDRGDNTELSAHRSDERRPAPRCSRWLPTAAGGVIGGAIAYHWTGFAATPTTGRSPAGKAATPGAETPAMWQSPPIAETPGHELRHYELRQGPSRCGSHDATSNPHEAARLSARLHHGNRPISPSGPTVKAVLSRAVWRASCTHSVRMRTALGEQTACWGECFCGTPPVVGSRWLAGTCRGHGSGSGGLLPMSRLQQPRHFRGAPLAPASCKWQFHDVTGMWPRARMCATHCAALSPSRVQLEGGPSRRSSHSPIAAVRWPHSSRHPAQFRGAVHPRKGATRDIARSSHPCPICTLA